MATELWMEEADWGEFTNPDIPDLFGLDVTWDVFPPNVIWTILDGDGTAVEGATLTIGGTEYTTDASGQVEIDSLAQGEYTVSLSKSGYLSYEWTETLHTGAAIEYRTVELLTLDQAGMPVAADVEAGVSYADGARTGTFVGSSHFTSVSVSVPSVEVEVG